MSKLEKACAVNLWMGRCPNPEILNPALEIGHTLQGAVPPRFQLAGNMALGGIDQLVLPTGEGSLISRTLEFPLEPFCERST